jgi:diguanylate cyclase (GGDEF)-like protein
MDRAELGCAAPRPCATWVDEADPDAAPLHAPELIQAHGALLALDPVDWTVTRASANLAAVLGVDAGAALGRRAAALLGEKALETLLQPLRDAEPQHARAAGARAAGARAAGQQRATRLRLPGQDGRFWLSVTAGRTACGRVCLELEPQSSQRGNGSPAAAPSAERTTCAVLNQLRSARSVADLCAAVVREMRRLMGHDRCMVYRFAPEGHGEVVAEDRSPHLHPYLGLRFPAADIPHMARQLFLQQRVRTIPDAARPQVRLLAPAAGGGPRLDLTHCSLRAVAPIHLDYMANMKTRASLVVALTSPDAGLWGLLVCHNAAPLAVAPALRELADMIGQVVSVLLASLISGDTLQAQISRERHLRSIAAALADTSRPILDGLLHSAPEMLAAACATGARVQMGGSVVRLGVTPSDSVALADMTRILARAGESVVALERFGAPAGGADGRAPDALAATAGEVLGATAGEALAATAGEAMAATAAGALLLNLPYGAGGSIVWFRPEVRRTVDWGGNPNRVVERDAETGRFSPRGSFEAWREIMRGSSAAWTDADRGAALEVRRIVGEASVRRAENEMARLRNIDALTGLRNRRLLQERLDALAGNGTTEAALIYIDLDRFKDVNDSLGHDAGDALLIGIADRLRSRIGEAGLVARLGGDEFAVLCEGAGMAHAEALADSVRAALDRPFELAARPYRATASVGVAHTSATGVSGAALLQAADAAMYVAKRAGGNGAASYAESLRDEVRRRFALEQDLRAALAARDGGLFLVYQPVVALVTGELLGFEALARWQHRDWGLVSPAEFVPSAETGGFVAELGDWVLGVALDQWAAWSARFPDFAGRLRLAVNVSPRQLGVAGGFARRIAAALGDRGLVPGCLVVEVTEAAVADAAAARELTDIRRLGVRVEIDDFGTGYSSLSYLRHLPADAVKLDRSFLPGAKISSDRQEDAAADEGFMTAVIAVAASAHLEVVVEGVETLEQLAASRRAGARSVQGFLFAKPMTGGEACTLLESLVDGRPAPWRGLISPLETQPATSAGRPPVEWRLRNELAGAGTTRQV